MNTIQTNSYQETQKIGEDFAKELHAGDILCLYGDLGAGKTTFMQGLAKGLAITHRIISPTFIIVRRYEIKRAKSEELRVKNLYHIDLYRTETEDDLKGLGIPEILEQKDAIIAIEWPEKMGELLPKKRWELRFEWMDENKRKVAISHYE